VLLLQVEEYVTLAQEAHSHHHQILSPFDIEETELMLIDCDRLGEVEYLYHFLFWLQISIQRKQYHCPTYVQKRTLLLCILPAHLYVYYVWFVCTLMVNQALICGASIANFMQMVRAKHPLTNRYGSITVGLPKYHKILPLVTM
jgi:hypothetical protein